VADATGPMFLGRHLKTGRAQSGRGR
jgi:hypothetical protein